MNDTERLPAAAEKTARTAPRRAAYPLPAPLPVEDVRRAEAALGFPVPPLLTALRTGMADGGIGPAYGPMPLTGDRTPDGAAWYGDDSEDSDDDEAAEPAPWPDYAARVGPRLGANAG